MMLDRFRNMINPDSARSRPLRHLAITLDGMESWSKRNNKQVQETYNSCFEMVKGFSELQIRFNIPIITVYLLPDSLKKEESFTYFMDSLVNLFEYMRSSETIKKNKVKISVLGKWYDIPSRGIEPIRSAIEETKDYDCFFLNFCIGYDGQEEILDACRLIARQVKSEKLDVDSITKETIKDNLYSSYFMPPSLVIKNGKKRISSDLLLWDLPGAVIHFSGKDFPDFKKQDFARAVEEFQRS